MFYLIRVDQLGQKYSQFPASQQTRQQMIKNTTSFQAKSNFSPNSSFQRQSSMSEATKYSYLSSWHWHTLNNNITDQWQSADSSCSTYSAWVLNSRFAVRWSKCRSPGWSNRTANRQTANCKWRLGRDLATLIGRDGDRDLFSRCCLLVQWYCHPPRWLPYHVMLVPALNIHDGVAAYSIFQRK